MGKNADTLDTCMLKIYHDTQHDKGKKPEMWEGIDNYVGRNMGDLKDRDDKTDNVKSSIDTDSASRTLCLKRNQEMADDFERNYEKVADSSKECTAQVSQEDDCENDTGEFNSLPYEKEACDRHIVDNNFSKGHFDSDCDVMNFASGSVSVDDTVSLLENAPCIDDKEVDKNKEEVSNLKMTVDVSLVRDFSGNAVQGRESIGETYCFYVDIDNAPELSKDTEGDHSEKQECSEEDDVFPPLFHHLTSSNNKTNSSVKENLEIPSLSKLSSDTSHTIVEGLRFMQGSFWLPSASVSFEGSSSSDPNMEEPSSRNSGRRCSDTSAVEENSDFREYLNRRRASTGNSRIKRTLSKLSLKQTFTALEQFINSFVSRHVFRRKAEDTDNATVKEEEKESSKKSPSVIPKLRLVDPEELAQRRHQLRTRTLTPGYRDLSSIQEEVEHGETFRVGWVRRRVTQIETILTVRESGEKEGKTGKGWFGRKGKNTVGHQVSAANQNLITPDVHTVCDDSDDETIDESVGTVLDTGDNFDASEDDTVFQNSDINQLDTASGDTGETSCEIKTTSELEALFDEITVIDDAEETLTTTNTNKEEKELEHYSTLGAGTEKTASSDETEDESTDTEEEEEEEGGDIGTVQLRQSRGVRACSFYRYSAVRPKTIIIALGPGVCTETHFLSGGTSFDDGVSETETDDEEDDGAPAPQHHHHHHNNNTSSSRPHSRGHSPTRTQSSRPHSPFSDIMDTESKRNSQAVSTEPSEVDDHSSVTTSDLESCHDPSSPRSSLLATDTAHTHHLDHAIEQHAQDARKDKAYRIALELLHTERTYVKVLHLIDQEFQFRVDNENRAHHMFPNDNIPHMFSNVKSIYKLHHDFLLPQLEDRMAQWEQNRRIGDIMKSFAPFLKMYTEYVRNFDNAMTLINQWQSKCPRFAAIMDEIHSMEVCGNLTLQHHMLSPVQRIPRYEMLIRDYLKKLPEESPDRHDTEKALQLVSMAANHANDAMKKIDKFEKLLEIQESLGGAVDLVSPTRELVKEGKIIKISARSGDHQERYVFLLTDLLLLCSPRLMGGRVMSGPQYRLRAKYNVDNLQVLEGDNLETANTFYIRDNNKSVELYTQTKEEKELWLEALFQAIHETYQRKSSLKLHLCADQRVVDVDLGQKQPTLVRSDSVTKCMECGSQFTMVRRKHHCRACGAVVCNKCSSFKASLAYESGKNVRVCRTCHAALQELSSSTATPSPDIDDPDECALHNAREQSDLAFRSRGVLEVSAKTGGAVMQGFLQLKTHRKAWVKRWFALHTDFVLYSFKCEADDQALTATPVPGFTVTHLLGTRNESGISDKEKERAFKLHHAKKHYIFQAGSKEESQRWVASLKKASQAELPSPVQ